MNIIDQVVEKIKEMLTWIHKHNELHTELNKVHDKDGEFLKQQFKLTDKNLKIFDANLKFIMSVLEEKGLVQRVTKKPEKEETVH